ncbi:D-alanyl-D-alanine carboxypeptidase/D-alanyl-D-alanine-endopeptidase [Ideonella sp. A 288]|uniref:D-alanyl-D-alanine carboxypeptidase/D-alanyl-D-alanine endopeptidase n=1 Tax=Ideonella sp. A 288 TaxID=1962181 RepID=UPI0011869647|nr:D-alanyl-D-alanine carboxypeptidase/D-alanyl-D-alanine-endopeptidase [Ideonella sp. A 288]
MVEPAVDWSSLPAALRPVVASAGLPPHSIGLMVQAMGPRATPLAALNAELPFQLASTAKVVTVLAALDLLGPHYRWRTHAFLSGPIHEGRLLGDLVIVGGGNAHLRSSDLQQWFASMQSQGLREVWGDIVLDRFAFRLTEHDHAHTPEPTAERPHHARPDALTLDEGVLRVAVQAEPKGPPSVTLTPPMARVRVDNAVSTKGPGCTVFAQATRDADFPQVSVQGRWGPQCGTRELIMAPWSHGEFSVRAVEGLWRAAGGKLKGRVIDKRSPDRESPLPTGPDGEALLPFMVHQSDELPAVIRDINKTSDNLGARNLMLSLANDFPNRAATMAEARRRVDTWLQRQGLQPGDIALENGSGLSREERGKPRAMVHLLRRAWASTQSKAFVDSLPVAGVDGTLANRMTDGPARGVAFLKTGSLIDTRALAGYVRARSGKAYAVTALVNHPEAPRATPALDALIEWVATNG